MERQVLHHPVIHFAGDSGDGIQVIGSLFSHSCALRGNDLQTFPDYPAEIRAPAGTLPGISGFQLHFADHPIATAGDACDVLIALNPAALRVHLPALKKGGLLLVDSDRFDSAGLKKAGYSQNPLENQSLQAYHLIPLALTQRTSETIQSLPALTLSHSEGRKCRNFFALGLMSTLFDRPLDPLLDWIEKKFQAQPHLCLANSAALKAGAEYPLTCELFHTFYTVPPAPFAAGTYRQITGNQAFALAIASMADRLSHQILVAGYPITPASEILHLLSHYQHFGIRVFQAEDEIAAAGAALGAAFGGHIAIACTSGPGMDLKTETLGLAVMSELPLVIINVQRAGPSTGMPTKAEQADLLQAIYGRHGECPLPVIAPSSPGDCFYALIHAVRMAIETMSPVILLSDTILANGSEPWALPDLDKIEWPAIHYYQAPSDEKSYHPYTRLKDSGARPWAPPGTAGGIHCLGGLEKNPHNGHISYEAEHHETMVAARAAKIAQAAPQMPAFLWSGPAQGDLLVISWGSTYGAVLSAVAQWALEHPEQAISHMHLRTLFPLPAKEGLCSRLAAFKKIIVPELNGGQLRWLLQAQSCIPMISFQKIQGKPFLIAELKEFFSAQVYSHE